MSLGKINFEISGNNTDMKRAFTLVELLIVVAVIGILVGLILPAVNGARASARRLLCTNNQRQWGVAHIAYENRNGHLVMGIISGTGMDKTNPKRIVRQSYVPYLWPWLEMMPQYDTFDFTKNFYETEINRASTTLVNPLFFCPCDRKGGIWQGADKWDTRSRGNYVVNWGYGDHWNYPLDGVAAYQSAAFGTNVVRQFAEFTDGRSNTIIMSEIIMAQQDYFFDFRGDVYNNDLDCVQFMTKQQPNSPEKDYAVCRQVTNEQLQAQYYCKPYNKGFSYNRFRDGSYTAARSYHPGGVNTTRGDGSVHWTRNDVSIEVWRALGTISGGEMLGDENRVGK